MNNIQIADTDRAKRDYPIEQKINAQAQFLEKHGWSLKGGAWHDRLPNLSHIPRTLSEALEIQQMRNQIEA